MALPEYSSLPTKQAMNRVSATGMPFEWSLNPYRGCMHGCAFCYARATHEFLGMAADDTFQRRILVKDDAPDALRRQLDRLWLRAGYDEVRFADEVGLVAIGTATDPYQPVEAKRRVTRACLEVLSEYPVRVSITTRSPLILRDIDLLKRLRVVAIHVSIHTVDPQVWRNLEPASPPPARRLETVRELVRAGLPAGAFVAPILPKLTDRDDALHALAEALRNAQARFAIPSMLRLAPEVKPWFFRVLSEAYPHLLPVYEALYRRGSFPPAGWVRQVMERAERILAAHGLSTHSYEHDAEHARAQGATPRSEPPLSSQAPRMRHGENRHSKGVQLLLPI